LLLVIATGCVAGFVHVLSGPDHLAAVAPLAAASRRRAWRDGLRWGLGHSGGVALIGLLLLWLRGVLPIERFSEWAEFSVGLTLWGIGVWAMRGALSGRLHLHSHEHGGTRHVHFHVHDGRTSHAPHAEGAHQHTHAALAVGTLHGLAGSSHFFGVLPALMLPGVPQAVLYLLSYGAGTVAAMALFAHTIGWALGSLERFGANAYRFALGTLAVIAMGTGTYWLSSWRT
jgi:hypothetical protein